MSTADTLKIHVLFHEPTQLPNTVKNLWLSSKDVYLDTVALKN